MTSTDVHAEPIVTQKPAPLPRPRGPVSSSVIDALHRGEAPESLRETMRAAVTHDSLSTDDDVQIAAFCLYELHYGGFDGVPDELEWHPHLVAARREFEQAFEAELRHRVPVIPRPEARAEAVAEALFAAAAEDGAPSTARYVARKATLEQAREFLVQRTLYTLKEADPHSWAIPRLSGRAKAALVEIQSDEYGGGRPHRMHSVIFANTVRAAGLDDRYGAYLDHITASTYASLNMMSMFGLNRRLRGAIVGHLAAFEMTSSIPNRFYGDGFRRLGFDEKATWYFDEHVEADAVHEQIAARDLAGGLVEAQPHLLDDVLFGASACLTVDGWAGSEMLEAWQSGRSALFAPLPS